MSLFLAFSTTLKRDLRLSYRYRRELLNPLTFFALVTSLFPLALNPEPQLLQTLAPGIIWVAALLATLLSLDRLFRADYLDGSLEQLLLTPYPLAPLILAKIIAHWLVTGLPLLLVATLLGFMLQLPMAAISTLLISLALGTPILSLIGAVGVALTITLRQGGMLLALLIFPLYIPVLIFGANAIAAAIAGLPVTGQLAWLSAILALAASFAPVTAAAALRIGIN